MPGPRWQPGHEQGSLAKGFDDQPFEKNSEKAGHGHCCQNEQGNEKISRNHVQDPEKLRQAIKDQEDERP